MTPEILTFEECLRRTDPNKRHVLLGNGFSRACRNQIFSYDSLFEAADFKELSETARHSFNCLGTTDFEVVMKAMQQSAKLLRLYSNDPSSEIAQKLETDAEKLRKALVTTIAAHHPSMPSDIQEREYAACIKFLRNFKRIYTLNYDLLLYWTLMKDVESERDDGFRDPFFGDSKDYYEEDYVEWVNSTYSQNVHYLHGALHIFYDGPSLQKYTWSRTAVRLLEQIDSALKDGRFPLIVAEGTSDQKLERIQKSNYLGHNFRSLGAITGALFVHGHSLAENDQHILRQVQRNGSIKNMFVSIYGDPSTRANQQAIAAAIGLAANRPPKKPLYVEFYSAATANVWG